jgi:hypothetical protein
MNNDLNALKEVILKLQKQMRLRKLVTMKFIWSQSANYLNKKTQTTYEVCNNTSKHKHLQKNSNSNINHFSTRDLQNQTKLAYNYNFKNSSKKKPLQLNCVRSGHNMAITWQYLKCCHKVSYFGLHISVKWECHSCCCIQFYCELEHALLVIKITSDVLPSPLLDPSKVQRS